MLRRSDRRCGLLVDELAEAAEHVGVGRRQHAVAEVEDVSGAAAGTFLLALTGITSLAHGRDYSFFPAVATVTNAAWLLGSIALAIALKRTRTAPVWVAYGLPVAWIGSIPLATHGGGLITGAFWMVTSLLVLGTERVGLTAATTTTA